MSEPGLTSGASGFCEQTTLSMLSWNPAIMDLDAPIAALDFGPGEDTIKKKEQPDEY